MKPFLKWVGGKRALLSTLKENKPKKFNRFFEPFVGGGAFFFSLNKQNSYISDVNKELIDTYKIVADDCNLDILIKKLIEHKEKNSKEHYEKVRNLDREENFSEMPAVERAARFIYLNKTCFNGVQRVNSKGYNNVPYGNHDNPNIFDLGNLLNCNELLKTTTIRQSSFEEVTDFAEAGDFVYFDPPYVNLKDGGKSKNSFTSYTKDDFSMNDQLKLKEVVDSLVKKDVYVMISNSYCDETIELYKDYHHSAVDMRRSVNSKGDERGKIKEILVTTYGIREKSVGDIVDNDEWA